MPEPIAPAAPAASPAPAAAPAAPAAATASPDPAAPPAAAAPPVAPKPPATALGDPPAPAADDKAVAADPNWRMKGARGDVDKAKRLERYLSEEDAFDALFAAQNRIAKGDVQKVLPANPTPEQLAEFRTANGIPEKPDGYKIEPGEGRVIGEADKPIIGKIVERFHGKHATPGQVNDAVQLYFDLQDETLAARETQDSAQKASVEDALRGELGPEYRANINAVKGMLSTFPEGVGEAMVDARLPDGTALFNNQAFLRSMMKVARELNPAATIVPGSTAASANAIGDRVIALKSMMADPESKYWKGTPDEQKSLRTEYDKLTAAASRLKAA